MTVKDNLTRRSPTQEEIDGLTFPRDKFDLVSVDYVDEWDSHKTSTSLDDPDGKKYVYRRKSVHITVKCKKCGTVKREATDRPDMSCKTGPCMPTWVDLTGQRFGKLLVESLDLSKTKKGCKQTIWYWRCMCDCGEVCHKTTTALVSHYHRMCPKCAKREGVRRTTLPDNMSKWHRMIRVYKKNAKVYGRKFELTDDQFIRLASSSCMYCGAEPSNNAYGVVCNGIDRIDSDKGYTAENTVACCRWCNFMKNKLSTTDFLKHVERIYNHSILGSKLNDHPEREYAPSGAEMGVSQ